MTNLAGLSAPGMSSISRDEKASRSTALRQRLRCQCMTLVTLGDRYTHVGIFADRLRELRLRTGLSQQLALKAGVHENYIARLERGERTNPSRDMVEAIARALDVPASAFYPDERPASVADILRDLSERCRMLETTQVPLRGTVPGEVEPPPRCTVTPGALAARGERPTTAPSRGRRCGRGSTAGFSSLLVDSSASP